MGFNDIFGERAVFMSGKVAIGLQSFEDIRSRDIFYIDKTDFIREWWESEDSVTLITRPRRFGKTLNLSMAECFFSNKYAGRADLFEGLSIWEHEDYRQMQGIYPVIFLSFAYVKPGKPEETKAAVKQIISNIYNSFRDIMEHNIFNSADREYFNSVNDNMDDKTAYIAINRLCIYLEKYYGRKVIILLDEYDTPMQEAWLSGCWEETAAFFRSFLNATFKTNPNMLRGLVTGITRIAKESIFSDLNNLEVVTTTSGKYSSCFGFTEQEVFKALDDTGLSCEKQGVKEWYDGFTFGNARDIYNPWSIINFISKNGIYDTYWADSSSNGLVNSLLREGSANVKQIVEQLLQGKSFEAEIDEQVVFGQFDDENTIWSLLLATGYLKACHIEIKGRLKKKVYSLCLVNMEVESMFSKMVQGWFKSSLPVYNEFIKALLNDDVKKMNIFINKVALNTFSSFDSGNKPSHAAEPERFYHGFVLGMVVDLSDRYKVMSNRESGYGRYDVMIMPFDKTQKAFILEFKVISPDDGEKVLEETVASALAQIEEKKYDAMLITDGIAPENIRKYAFAFEGKKCLVG